VNVVRPAAVSLSAYSLQANYPPKSISSRPAKK
jgi:hypothetical protein